MTDTLLLHIPKKDLGKVKKLGATLNEETKEFRVDDTQLNRIIYERWIGRRGVRYKEFYDSLPPKKNRNNDKDLCDGIKGNEVPIELKGKMITRKASFYLK
jgi:hypothetical protein